MTVQLYEHQKKAVEQLKNGNILVGGVGSGKSRTALAYYFVKVCGGEINELRQDLPTMKEPRDLYIITTARKRDTLEWEKECLLFGISSKKECNISGVKVIIDSWNNIKNYVGRKHAFFIFDEQRVVGSGMWVKSFLKITQSNEWVLLSATPGDTWMDYIPVFVANKFYKNTTEFKRRHVVYSRYSKFPKVERYMEISRLIKLRDSLIVNMHYQKKTIVHNESIVVGYDLEQFNSVAIKRWNIYEHKPIRDISEYCFLARKVVNSDPRRLDAVCLLFQKHPKIIVFYNFNYERAMLLSLRDKLKVPITEWNGFNHEPIPNTESWIYIVQYAAGAEGWNCIETDTIIFYSQSYSYKATIQAGGRIDRINSPFTDLYYYYLRSTSTIDLAIKKAFEAKKDFNEKRFVSL